jgi:hypothetical protein
MNDHLPFSRVAAITAIVAAPLALLSTFIAIWAVGFDFELLDEPVSMVALDARAAGQFRWSWILAAFGFYLLLVPAVLYLRYWLKSQKPNLVRMYTVFGLGYCFIGTISLFTMATVLSPMMHAYPEALPPERDFLVAVFQASANLAFASLGTLSFILGGVWWLGIGLELRARYRLLGIVTVVLGIATLALVGATFSRLSHLPGWRCSITSWVQYGLPGSASSSGGRPKNSEQSPASPAVFQLRNAAWTLLEGG